MAEIIAVLSVIIGIIGFYLAYKTYRHQQGEIVLKFTNLPRKKSIRDNYFNENIPDISLKIINSSDFSIPIEKVYAVLGNPDHPDIFNNKYNDSCIKKCVNFFSAKNTKIENKELHVNLLDSSASIDSSKSISISLKDKLISENLCCTLVEGNEDFCLLVKTIYVQAESGKIWELPGKLQTHIQEYTYSFQVWKQSEGL